MYTTTEPLTEGESIQLAEQASLAQIAIRSDALGPYSPWDTSILSRRLDSQTKALIKDAVKAARQDSAGSIRMDAPGMLPESLTAYDPDFVMEDYQETLYADPGFLAIEDMNRPGVDRVTMQSVNRIGRFRVGGDRTSNTEPLDAGMSSTQYPTQYIHAHVNYSTRELDSMSEARRNGNIFGFLDIVQYKLTEVVEASYKEELNRTNALGIPSLGIYGLHTHFAIPRMDSPIRLNENSTPDEYVTVFRQAKQSFVNNSGKRLMSIDGAFISSDLKIAMQSRLMGSSGNVSVLDWVMRSFGIKEIYCTPQVDYAGGNGGNIVHLFVNNRRHTKAVVTKKLTQDGRAYKEAGLWRVDYDAALMGTAIKKPYEHLIVENVAA